MRILAIEKAVEGVSETQFTPEIMAAEALQAWRLHQAGVIRELYFHDEQDSAVLILECSSVAEADAALASLPMVGAGLIQFDVLPLRAYPGFERLFGAIPEQ